MLFGFYSDYQSIKSANPNLSFDVVPVPQLTGQNINVASYFADGVSVKGTHQKEALLLMKYLARKETASKFSQPSPFSNDGDKLKGTPTFVFSSQGGTAVSSYLTNQIDNGLNSKLSSALGTAINSIISGTATPDSAAQTLLSSFSQILGQASPK